MAMILSENQKSDYKPIDEGTYVAVCCHLIDIGDHYSEQYDKSQVAESGIEISINI